MIKYLGSKRTLTPLLERLASRLPIGSACDLFAGTTRVGQAFRRAGCRVVSNDLATYSEAFGHAYIAADERLDRPRLRSLLARLEALPGRRRATSPRPSAGRRATSRPATAPASTRCATPSTGSPTTRLSRGCLLTSLIEAADRVDSTCGLQMAYLKRPAPRSLRELELREPEPVPGPAGEVTRLDAAVLARRAGRRSTAPTSTRPTTTTPTSRTTTCGRRSRAGTAPRPTASRESASTAGRATAASTARARRGTRWPTWSRACARPG